jgi:hypothetical protein
VLLARLAVKPETVANDLAPPAPVTNGASKPTS